jgi:hypothetical protein
VSGGVYCDHYWTDGALGNRRFAVGSGRSLMEITFCFSHNHLLLVELNRKQAFQFMLDKTSGNRFAGGYFLFLHRHLWK